MKRTIPPETRQAYRTKGVHDAAQAEGALAAWDELMRTGVIFEGPYHAFVQGYLAGQEEN